MSPAITTRLALYKEFPVFVVITPDKSYTLETILREKNFNTKTYVAQIEQDFSLLYENLQKLQSPAKFPFNSIPCSEIPQFWQHLQSLQNHLKSLSALPLKKVKYVKMQFL